MQQDDVNRLKWPCGGKTDEKVPILANLRIKKYRPSCQPLPQLFPIGALFFGEKFDIFIIQG
jgi:hypothetical protein